ncbi:hypothetical protein CEUSTIGMA_g3369.t1 [Chlamydomonas eustigma]|uniref:EF-hand domain-containing protein n=1 Tax=Chlamydomonas eustigma TaxID=1157962 RepID=A0A250WYR5_9CHLO|nr:hypothetical protein CEUSTIGMA_g3369.t1 [Chlamydomonas eustigma]|eukprot:GAX75926.1 hypothetical protein CEUSTIGMA_g3369.t1 [Chlamydomonas eustigma]
MAASTTQAPATRDEEGEGDLYSELATNILLEKRARKLAEDDALRLYNRVRQLEKEEDKAQRRIQETRKKAKEIVKLRERNELVRQEKELRMRQLQELVEQQRLENARLKEENLRNKIEQENKIYSDKVTVVQQTKEERAEYDRLLAESKLLSRKEALEQKEFIRRQQEDARKKIEQLKISRLQMAQEEYERRLKEEMDAKLQKEKEIEQLAQLELELIGRLRTKQTEQQKAFQQLEAVLSLGASGSGKQPASKLHPSAPAAPSTPPQSGEPSEEDVARAFSVYDVDGTGEVSTQDLQGLMQDLGVPLNATQLSQAVSQLDPASAGKVTFGDFLLWWKG